ncbi:UNVERIFIED_ORG: TetR/AcrR family transcriptional regulator [Shinella sp. XGS7]|nr:TetR/AcrR family transcriptional regulator [Shinella sp. XGS7]
MSRVSFKEQVQRVREDAIVGAVNRLLASKGYELMTVDEVAAEAGLSKASLYKHFTSKEELAAAAMVKVLERALQQVQEQAQRLPEVSALGQLQDLVRWTLRTQLAGEMPSLPAQNSRLVAALKEHRDYMNRLLELSDRLGEWILAAQGSADIDPGLPPELVLYTLFARACDPVVGLLKAGGQHSDAQIVDWVTATTFRGLAGAATAPQRKSR